MTVKNYTEDIILVELPAEPDIRAELDHVMDLIDQGRTCDCFVDFSNVTIISSMAISGFLQLRKLIKNAGRRLIFYNASNITKDIFRVTCLDAAFEYADDLNAAEEMLISKVPTYQV